MASHGAAAGILLALLVFSRTERLPYLWILDRIAITVALSGFLVRTGNLFNSEIFGLPTALPWGFEFVRSPDWYHPPVYAQPCHPTQIYEALSCLLIALWLGGKKMQKSFPGFRFGAFLVSLFTMRFLIEFLKIDQVDFESGMLLNMGQLLSVPLVICGIYVLADSRKKFNASVS